MLPNTLEYLLKIKEYSKYKDIKEDLTEIIVALQAETLPLNRKTSILNKIEQIAMNIDSTNDEFMLGVAYSEIQRIG